jgi:hypothetical protein
MPLQDMNEVIPDGAYIYIGNYRISKMISMSIPTRLRITDTVTNITRVYGVDELIAMIKREGLSNDAIMKYYDEINEIVVEQRININELLQKAKPLL